MNGIVRCVAVDDEPLALEVISKLCDRLGGVDLEVFCDPDEALAEITNRKPDLVFLDIEMDGVNGLALARKLPEGTCFIFTTAYPEYALEGYDLDAVDYLHKPFSYDRFQKAFAKALRRIEYNRGSREEATNIVVKQEYSNISIPVSDIVYIEAMEGYSKIFRKGGARTLSRGTLKAVQSLLPVDGFIRIHRSYVVAIGQIESFTKQELKLRTGEVLPVGRQYAADVMKTLKR